MANFPNQTITAKGLALLAKATSGTIIQFTAIGMGDGKIGSASISGLNQLISLKETLPIKEYKRSAASFTVMAYVSNADPDFAGFYWREVGLYAVDPDEGTILFSYANAGEAGDNIPGYGGQTFAKYITLTTAVGNAENVTVQLDEPIIVTKQEFDQHKNDKRKHVNVVTATGTGSSLLVEDMQDELTDGLQLFIKLPENLQAGAKLKCGSGELKSIKTEDGNAVTSGAKAGMYLPVIYNAAGDCWIMYGAFGREDLTGYYTKTQIDSKLTTELGEKADKTDTSLFCGSSSGSAGYMTVSNSNIVNLINGTRIRFVPHINCAEGCQLKLNSFSAYPIHNSKGAVKADDLKAGIPVELNYYGGKYFFNQPGFSKGDVLGPGEAEIECMKLREIKEVSIETENSFYRVWCNRINNHYYVCFAATNSNSNDMIAKYDLNWNNIWVADMQEYNAIEINSLPYVDTSGNVYTVKDRYGYKISSAGDTISKVYYGLSVYTTGRYVYAYGNGTLTKYDITDTSKTAIWQKSISSVTGLIDDGTNIILYSYASGTLNVYKLDYSSGETVRTASVTGLSTAYSPTYYIAGCTKNREYYMYSHALNNNSGDKIYVLNADFTIKCEANAYMPRPYDSTYLGGIMPIDNYGNLYVYPSIANEVKPTYIIRFGADLSREIIILGEYIPGIGIDYETDALICSIAVTSNKNPAFYIYDMPKVKIK